jgi:hypothetical protein
MTDAAGRADRTHVKQESAKLAYNPNQPRVPAGHHDGGEWTDGKDRQLWKLQIALAKLLHSMQDERPRARSQIPGAVDLAAMSWHDRRGVLFGQRDLLEVGGGSGGSAPWLPLFRRIFTPFKGKPTSGVLRIPGRRDIELVSGSGGPTSMMPKGSPGFDGYTLEHAEGQAAALMQHLGIKRGTLYINNPTICSNCTTNLSKMLPPGATLDVVLPNGDKIPFSGKRR